MKKVISLFLSLAMLLSIVSVVDFSAYASVETGKCGDNVTYSLDTSTGLLTISGTGDMYDYGGSSYSPFKNYYSSSIKSVIIKNGVTSIGNGAFYDCTSLISITIPDSVTSIGEYAFCNCTSLTSITIPNSVTSICYSAFYGCTSLTSITIPDSVTSIGGSAFSGCTSLTNITIPNSVTSIGNNAFRGCTSLTNVTIPDSVTSIGEYAFCNCTSLTLIDVSKNNKKYISIDGVLFDKDKTKLIQYPAGSNRTIYSIPNSVISIGSDAFVGCTSLTSVTIPDSVTSIGSGAFRSCTSLTSVKIPNSVTSIGNYTFSGCTSLTSITISDSVKSIGWNAFSGCTSLTSVTIPNSVTSIDNNAFRGCTNLTIVTIPNSVTSIGGYAFSKCTNLTSIDVEKDNSNYSSQDGVLFNKDKTRLIQYPIGNKRTTYNIPNNVTSIELYAFSGCTNLTSITISNSITNIGNSAFRGCTSLVSVTIPDSVTSIDVGAFEDCTSLTSITIPNSVISIQPYAFQGCTSLTSVTIPDSVTSIGDYIFQGCTSLKSVNYSGTKSQWESIKGYNSISQIVKCNDGIYAKSKEIIIDGITFKLSDYYTTQVTGYSGSLVNITIPESVAYEGLTFNVTSIGDKAFYKCTSLASVTISNSVTSIGDYAFCNCTSLISATIPYSVKSIGDYAFCNCTSLISATIPYSVKSIGDYAFCNCTSLTSVTIPDSVTSIGDHAFDCCTSLTSVTISDSVKSIGDYAFSSCENLTSVTIPGSVTSIGRSTFYNCTSLTSIDYNGTVSQWKSIKGYGNVSKIIKCTDGIIGNGNTVTIDNLKYKIYDDTASLVGYVDTPENLMIPKSFWYDGYTFKVSSIGVEAFYNCTSLTSVTIPNSVTSIGSSAFSGCTSLKSFNYSGTKSQWKAITIGSDNYYLTHAFIKCTDGIIGNGNTVTVDSVKYRLNDDYTAEVTDYSGMPGNITILESVTYEGLTFKVTSIGSSAFSNCTSLKSATIPDSVASIGDSAFSGCTSLTSVTIPNSVESIGDNAFQNCSSLTSATIGNNVTSIGSSAFFGCSKLKKIEVPDSVTYIGIKAFNGTAFYNTVKNWEDGVLYCGNHLISAKSDVTKITVKASTVSIAAGALDNCKSLKKINVLNPKCVINCTIPKTAVIGGAEGSTAEDFAQKNNMSIDYFEECTHSDKVQVVIAATCTEQGAVQSRCADCDKLISQTFTAPLGHTMVITTPAKAPTCTTSCNTQAGYCTVCGYNEVSTVIPATGHNFGNNSANCLVCGVANPNYVAPTQPTPITTPTQPNQNDTNTSNDEDVTVTSKPKSASIKKVKGAKKAISVTWKKVSGVNGYEIQVATDKKFKKNKKTVTIKKQKTTKTTVKKLKAKKKYYVRVRTYKIVNGKKVYSSWSKVKSVKTK